MAKKVENGRKWAVGCKDGQWVYRNASTCSKKGSCCCERVKMGDEAWKLFKRLGNGCVDCE